jgi:hypothetical protein
MGLVRMVRPWDEWLVVWGYDIDQPPPQVDDAMATKIVHDLVGDDTIPVTIRSTSLWGNNKMYATRYRSGRVFCAGDAVHRHPPSNGLGSNTSVQDSYVYDDWARLREVTESGCVLVRPDAHVGWRAHELPSDPEKDLTEALAHLLDRAGGEPR